MRGGGPGRALAVVALVAALAACDRAPAPDSVAAAYDYPAGDTTCTAPPPTPARAGGTIATGDRLDVLVRVPRNYRPGFAHPLLVVYAAAGMTPESSEHLTGYTPLATAAGFIVAYARHVRPSRAAIAKLARVPAAVAAHYCVDAAHVFMSGHSDGGTTSTAVAAMPETNARVAGLAPSAAGFTGADLATFACPAPRPVLVWHGARDTLFPGYGREAAAWWAKCNACDAAAPAPVEGCVHYAGCRAPVQYCEGDYGHLSWPPQGAARSLEFFEQSMRKP